jgi:D-alanyl-D-alanine carboxypeptidase (penicillin-binding protein 5/6)
MALVGVLLVLLSWPAVAAADTQSPPHLQGAKAAILMEASTGDVLFADNIDQRRPIASTTKLMTVLVALEHDDLDDVFSAVDYHAQAAESLVGLRAGERMTVRDLLRAALLPSANDAAATLAVGTLASTGAFVNEMNNQAAALGLHDTHYANPVGLDDPQNYSSARDLAKLAIKLRSFEFFRKTTDLPSAVLRSGSHKRVVTNRNTLVHRYPYVNGVKTGHTNRAGFVLVGSARQNGVTVISAVLGEPSERLRDADSIALLRYGLRSYQDRTLLSQGHVLGHVALRYRGDDHVDVVAGATAQRVLRRGATTHVAISGLPHEVDGPLPRATRVGTATILRGSEVLARVPLVTAEPVAQAGFGTRLESILLSTRAFIALLALLACSLPLVVLRRRAVSRRRALEAESRRARRREEPPVYVDHP